MTYAPPADIGVPTDVIETPALVVDLEAFEGNLHRMAHLASGSGVKLRPHAKAHKAPAIAQLQLAAGAIGVCCQKVSEAQAFVQAGTPDVLVTNQIVDIRKLERLSRLAQTASVTVCVDHPYHVDQLASVARTANPPIRVLVELNVGGGRCGVAPGP